MSPSTFILQRNYRALNMKYHFHALLVASITQLVPIHAVSSKWSLLLPHYELVADHVAALVPEIQRIGSTLGVKCDQLALNSFRLGRRSEGEHVASDQDNIVLTRRDHSASRLGFEDIVRKCCGNERLVSGPSFGQRSYGN